MIVATGVTFDLIITGGAFFMEVGSVLDGSTRVCFDIGTCSAKGCETVGCAVGAACVNRLCWAVDPV